MRGKVVDYADGMRVRGGEVRVAKPIPIDRGKRSALPEVLAIQSNYVASAGDTVLVEREGILVSLPPEGGGEVVVMGVATCRVLGNGEMIEGERDYRVGAGSSVRFVWRGGQWKVEDAQRLVRSLLTSSSEARPGRVIPIGGEIPRPKVRVE